MQQKLPTLNVRELINLLQKFDPTMPVMIFSEYDIVQSAYVKDVYEHSYINADKYTSENDFYNVVTIHVQKTVEVVEDEEEDEEDDEEWS
jgi:hypothetical protein